MDPRLGILSAAVRLPRRTRPVPEIFAEEGVPEGEGLARRLGIERVPVADGERGSELALAAAREALERAGVAAADVDVIVDATALPQEYLVPAWSMSNKLQHELGAKKAFTIGFSGAGATGFQVGLHFAACLVRSDPRIRHVLWLAADLAIPGNRVLAPEDPVTVLGDAASAVLLGRDADRDVVVDTALASDGALHDVCYIPGGAMTHPDRRDLFRLRLDRAAYRAASRVEPLFALAERVLHRHGLALSDVAVHLHPNLSAQEEAELDSAFGVHGRGAARGNLADRGHLQANDFVVNWLSAADGGSLRGGDWILAVSHGFGFTSGVSLLRH
jgi:3-oxoacyl-[acyl-carrier-protein] synthase-3